MELVSFEEIERLLAQERRQDMSSILHGAVDPGRTLRMLLEADDIDVSDPDVCALCGQLGLGHILERGLRFLSTGEIRKSLLARALAKDPRLLVIDDPFDGLDRDSQSELSRVIHRAATGERAIVIVGGRARDRLPEVTHELQIDGGVVQYAGPLRSAASESADLVASHPHFQIPAVVTDAQKHAETGTELISMNDVFVSYGSTPILRNIDWSVRAGTHWMVFGPNGSGKSTLLSLVSGENPKAYGQQIELFGRRRGSGESVAEIRRHIGFVSGDLQLRFPLRTGVLDTVVSGFFDTVGLFSEPAGLQVKLARQWLERLSLAWAEERRLRDLSFGQRRLLLIARAVVKGPQLLIADEPCQGLDEQYTHAVLDLLESIGSRRESTLLYVTHNVEEKVPCIDYILKLEPDNQTGSRAMVLPAGRV